MARSAKPTPANAKAKSPVGRKRNREGSGSGELQKRLAEALAQHAAIGEILNVMSASPSDVQPVLDAVAERAAHLCEAPLARVRLLDGDEFRAMAEYSLDGTSHARTVPLPLKRTTIIGRAVLDRATIHHDDVVPLLETEYPDALNARRLGLRAVLAVPLIREGKAYGVILLWRREPGLFSREQVALVQTFAQQAAIAVDNVRLFNETKEALEQQTSISEILRVISTSPGDVKPVLDAVADRALKLCDAADATIFLREGDKLRRAARFGSPPVSFPVERFISLTRGSVTGRAVIDRVVMHMEDAATAADEEFPLTRELRRRSGSRAILSVPLVREDVAIGAITLWRREARRFTAKQIALVKTFADQAAIAIENVRLVNETKEALERQTAISEILRVISSSPTDVHPMLSAVVERAATLCEAPDATIFLAEGDKLRSAARFGSTRRALEVGQSIPLTRGSATGRATIDRTTIHLEDLAVVLEDEYPVGRQLQRSEGNHTLLAVPLMREDRAIGAITLFRTEVRPFTEKQISLVKTFADQAAIAIENVRLFNETEEALERQTATSEILRVISQSPTDVQPVFDTIAGAALRLCSASSASVFTFDGQLLHLAALAIVNPEAQDAMRKLFPRPVGRDKAAGRAVLARSVVAIPDVLEDPDFAHQAVALASNMRSLLDVPLMREGSAIGAIAVGRPEPGPFPETQIALLQTFADQAAIAIENVRLFNETKEALERQTATSEILGVISRSPTDVQPVFEIISERAAKLCGADVGIVTRVEDEQIHLAAIHGVTEKAKETITRLHPMPLSIETVTARAIRGCAVEHISDVMADSLYEKKDLAAVGGWRGCLAVPMLREGQVIGAIFVARASPGLFADAKIQLLETFADQAVIAIENVRLFTELEARTAQLTRSVGELEALSEVGQAVSSTLDLETVLSTIVSRAVQLAGMDGGSIWEYDQAREQFYVRATDRLPDELVEVHRASPIRKGEGALGRLVMTGEPVEVGDIADESTYQSGLRETLIRCGYRSVLAVPLLREDHLLGALAVSRITPGGFAPEVIALLKTFATQSALAIQNARLYREIEVKSRELEAASRHKSEFLANMSHELRTPLNAILGFSEILAERMFGEINEKQAEYIGDILQSGQHLLSLINDILDLSKIEAGRMELELSEFALPSTIESTLTLVRERAMRHGIELGATVDERLGMVRADERKVKQVLLNLLSNALKFTPEGGRIDVRAAVRDGTAEVSVTDTGVGISPEDQEAVFEEFRQVGTASKKAEGTGLGLAISRKFIHLHGGRMWVESQVGTGSTFAFTLPLQ